MSKYTTEVRFICEMNTEEPDVKNPSSDWYIEHSREKIFDFEYPIFDETYRSVIETKILKRYYTREICAETVGRWKLFLNQRMNEIMPYYNKLYESELLKFNPLQDVDLTIDHRRENDGTETGQGTRNTDTQGNNKATGTNWEYYSDTPQGTVGNLDNHTYLTNATKTTKSETTDYEQGVDEATSTSKTVNSTEDYLEHIVGKRGGQSYSELLKKYRDTFINIDMMVLDDLQDLFFNLW